MLVTSERLRRRLRDRPQKRRDFSSLTGPFLLTSGLVVHIKANTSSVLLRHPSCKIWVHFHGRNLPSGIAYGKRVWVIGILKSYNVGDEYALTSAYCLSKSPRAIVSAGLAKHPDAVIDHWTQPDDTKGEIE